MAWALMTWTKFPLPDRVLDPVRDAGEIRVPRWAEPAVRDAPIAVGQRQVVIGRQAAVGAEHAAGCFRELCSPGGSANRTDIGPAEIGVGHGLLLYGRLGGIWEAASGANRPEPVPTGLNQSL
jgi:hypothetical protein